MKTGERGPGKPRSKKALLEMIRAYFKPRGFRVSSIREEGDRVVVRFPDGGPMGLKKCSYGQATIQQIEESFL